MSRQEIALHLLKRLQNRCIFHISNVFLNIGTYINFGRLCKNPYIKLVKQAFNYVLSELSLKVDLHIIVNSITYLLRIKIICK